MHYALLPFEYRPTPAPVQTRIAWALQDSEIAILEKVRGRLVLAGFNWMQWVLLELSIAVYKYFAASILIPVYSN